MVRVAKAAAVVVAVPVAVLAVCPPVAVALAWAVDRPWAVDLADAVVDRRGPGDLVVDLRAAVAAGFREVDAAVEFRVAAVPQVAECQAASAAEREAVGLAELPAEACRGAVAAVRAAELP